MRGRGVVSVVHGSVLLSRLLSGVNGKREWGRAARR